MSKITAADLNAHLTTGGVVQVTTRLRSTVFEPKHAGMFVDKGGEVYMQRGKHLDCLTMNGKFIVAVRTGRYA